MSIPIFVIGPQRSGTSILARTICLAEGVADKHYNPCPRWDIVAMAELGAQVRETPWLDRMDGWLANRPEKYAVVRFALPWAVESFGWPRLAKGRSEARFVFIHRDVQDTYASWRTLEYLPREPLDGNIGSYCKWHEELVGMAFREIAERKDITAINYESMVREGARALCGLWFSLDLTPPDLDPGWFHKPKHWSGDPA